MNEVVRQLLQATQPIATCFEPRGARTGAHFVSWFSYAESSKKLGVFGFASSFTLRRNAAANLCKFSPACFASPTEQVKAISARGIL